MLAEDTRHTAALLSACGIARPLLSLHDHNESSRLASLLARLQGGEIMALVSDAGTPLLSDPGFLLVRAAAAAGIAVRAIPGPSAVTAALAVAGLPTDRFVFEGFLPARAGERQAALGRLAVEARTMVLFEAPHRIAKTLEQMAAAFGPGRAAVIARELTKVFETVYRGTLAELAERARAGEGFRARGNHHRGGRSPGLGGGGPTAHGSRPGAPFEGSASGAGGGRGRAALRSAPGDGLRTGPQAHAQ